MTAPNSPCPFCYAEPGQACYSQASGQPTAPHAARAAAHASRLAIETAPQPASPGIARIAQIELDGNTTPCGCASCVAWEDAVAAPANTPARIEALNRFFREPACLVER